MSKLFQPIFIVGVCRSGTSLLQGMLNAQSAIAFPPETHYIRNYLSRNIKWESVKHKLPEDKYLKNLDIDLVKTVHSSTGLKGFYIRLMEDYLEKKGKLFIGDKDPKNIEYLKTIKKYFPNAQIIHIYRDPRAVIASRLKAEWSEDTPLWQHILAYKAQFNYFRRNAHLFGENVLEVKYENLVTRPEIELNKILSMLELDFEKNMLNFCNSASEIVKGKEIAWKENLYKPVMAENIQKWKNELNQHTIGKIEKALYSEMNILDYKANASSRFHSTLFLFLSFLYSIKSCK